MWRYIYDLRKIALWLKKDFDKCTKEDIETLIIDLDNYDYSEWTIYGFKVLVRKFFRWLRGTKDLPPEVSWVKLLKKNNGGKLPEEILTEKEVRKLVECSETMRDRAFISLLTGWESRLSCRIAYGKPVSLALSASGMSIASCSPTTTHIFWAVSGPGSHRVRRIQRCPTGLIPMYSRKSSRRSKRQG